MTVIDIPVEVKVVAALIAIAVGVALTGRSIWYQWQPVRRWVGGRWELRDGWWARVSADPTSVCIRNELAGFPERTEHYQ